MKKIFLLILPLLLLFVIGDASAQTSKAYKDSVSQTGFVNYTATPGYGNALYFRTDITNYPIRGVCVKMPTNETDSVKFQLGYLYRNNDATGVPDTAWQDMILTWKKLAAINTGGGTAVARDTSAIWITNKGNSGVADNCFEFNWHFGSYIRAVRGNNDSGKVHIVDIRPGRL